MVGTVFVGVILGKPLRDFIRPLGSPKGLKGFLHTLNAIVHPTKDRFILLFFNFIYCFVLLRD
jgi:hypothetical protein